MHLCWSSILTKLFYQKETVGQGFFWEFFKILQSSFSEEHIRASVFIIIQTYFTRGWCLAYTEWFLTFKSFVTELRSQSYKNQFQWTSLYVTGTSVVKELMIISHYMWSSKLTFCWPFKSSHSFRIRGNYGTRKNFELEHFMQCKLCKFDLIQKIKNKKTVNFERCFTFLTLFSIKSRADTVTFWYYKVIFTPTFIWTSIILTSI